MQVCTRQSGVSFIMPQEPHMLYLYQYCNVRGLIAKLCMHMHNIWLVVTTKYFKRILCDKITNYPFRNYMFINYKQKLYLSVKPHQSKSLTAPWQHHVTTLTFALTLPTSSGHGVAPPLPFSPWQTIQNRRMRTTGDCQSKPKTTYLYSLWSKQTTNLTVSQTMKLKCFYDSKTAEIINQQPWIYWETIEWVSRFNSRNEVKDQIVQLNQVIIEKQNKTKVILELCNDNTIVLLTQMKEATTARTTSTTWEAGSNVSWGSFPSCGNNWTL